MPKELKTGTHGQDARATMRYARNAEQLARAFFHPRELSPRKKRRTIAIVSEWLSAADFPGKNPPSKGWRIDEVEEWLRGKTKTMGDGSSKMGDRGDGGGEKRTLNIEHSTFNAQHSTLNEGMGKGGNGERRTLNAERRTSKEGLPAGRQQHVEGELPVQEKPVEGELFESQESAYEKTLDLWEDKLKDPVRWMDAPIQKWQIEELKRKRGHLFGELRAVGMEMGDRSLEIVSGTLPTPNFKLPDAESQKALAVRLAQHFRGRVTIDISEQQISKWKSGEGLQAFGAPLPPAKLGNRFESQAWADWIERFILPRYGVKTNPQGLLEPSIFDRANEAEAQRKIDEGARVRIDLEVTQGKYIELAQAERLVAGLARQYHEFWKARNEKEETEAVCQFCRGLGMEEARVEELRVFVTGRARDFLALVEERCAVMAGEAETLLTAD